MLTKALFCVCVSGAPQTWKVSGWWKHGLSTQTRCRAITETHSKNTFRLPPMPTHTHALQDTSSYLLFSFCTWVTERIALMFPSARSPGCQHRGLRGALVTMQLRPQNPDPSPARANFSTGSRIVQPEEEEEDRRRAMMKT